MLLAAAMRLRGECQSDVRQAFRDCVGAFPTGVTIVTAAHQGRTAGMTVNSFASVSLDPLVVSVALATGTRTLELVRQSERYVVSILERGQLQVAVAFASNGAPFPVEHTRAAEDGQVTIPGTLATLRCRVRERMPAGDHDVLLGDVTSFEVEPGEPLVFHRGAFGGVDVGAMRSPQIGRYGP